jgi:hypothetical protein
VISPLLCAIFISNLQQTLNNHATNMTFRSDIYQTVISNVKKSIISIKVGDTEHTYTPNCMKSHKKMTTVFYISFCKYLCSRRDHWNCKYVWTLNLSFKLHGEGEDRSIRSDSVKCAYARCPNCQQRCLILLLDNALSKSVCTAKCCSFSFYWYC